MNWKNIFNSKFIKILVIDSIQDVQNPQDKSLKCSVTQPSFTKKDPGQ